jgi:hypothetical protein
MPMLRDCALAAVLMLAAGAAQAQTQTGDKTKVTPGTGPTEAVGSQVPSAKVDCPDTAATTQGQHAPTAGVGSTTPTMTKPADCPDGKPAGQQK